MGKVGKAMAGVLGGGLGYGLASGKIGLGDIAKYGGFGLAGMAARDALRKKKKKKPGEPEGGMTAGAEPTMRRGGKVKKMAKGGKVTRGDGCCKQGHTKGKMR
jgi:hypothetical protein